MSAYHNQDAATQAAMQDNYYEEQERQHQKRVELLSKFLNGGQRYNNETLFRNVIEGLVRGADPLDIIEKLMEMNKELHDRIKEYLLHHSSPARIQTKDPNQ